MDNLFHGISMIFFSMSPDLIGDVTVSFLNINWLLLGIDTSPLSPEERAEHEKLLRGVSLVPVPCPKCKRTEHCGFSTEMGDVPSNPDIVRFRVKCVMSTLRDHINPDVDFRLPLCSFERYMMRLDAYLAYLTLHANGGMATLTNTDWEPLSPELVDSSGYDSDSESNASDSSRSEIDRPS